MKKTAFIITVFLVIALTGCEKNWLDINKDPNVPTVAEPNKLLTGTQVNFGFTSLVLEKLISTQCLLQVP
jgi:hypothetical protein